MLVAMPTAIPCEPLTSRLGTRAGSTTGSWRRWSYVGMKSTVSRSRSSSISEATYESRASVYRIAAGGSPASEPKFPCLSISTSRIIHFWARRTSVG